MNPWNVRQKLRLALVAYAVGVGIVGVMRSRVLNLMVGDRLGQLGDEKQEVRNND